MRSQHPRGGYLGTVLATVLLLGVCNGGTDALPERAAALLPAGSRQALARA